MSDRKVQILDFEKPIVEIQKKIDAKKQELTQAGIPFDLGRINQISKDIIDLEKRVKNLFEDQKKLKELTSKRMEIIQKRIDNKKPESLRLQLLRLCFFA